MNQTNLPISDSPNLPVNPMPDPPTQTALHPFIILHSSFLPFLRGRGGDLVWSALVMVTVLLPLASLTIDVPRYVVLRSRLQLAADAAALATAQCVDHAHFQNTGQTQLDFWCYLATPGPVFNQTVAPLVQADHYPTLTGVMVNDAAQAVVVTAQGTTRLFFSLSPPITIRVEAQARYRAIVR